MANEPVRSWNPWILVVGAVVLAALVVAVLVLGDDDEDDPVASTTSEATTTTEAPTTTTTEATTTTTGGSGVTDQEAATVVWPDPFGTDRYDDPLDAVEAFAEDFVGFDDPSYGELREGDARSGEVEVRAVADGPATTVLVRRMSDDAWYVIGSTTPNVEVDQPTPGNAVDAPVLVSGRARAFEGTVQVTVHERGVAAPLGQGFVTGSGSGELGPFSGEIERDSTEARWGVVLFVTHGGEDGRVWEAVALPVGFIGAD